MSKRAGLRTGLLRPVIGVFRGTGDEVYWGTPIPIWVSDDYQEVVCIGSVAELEQYAGHPIPDIHRHFIDDIKIPSKTGRGYLHRVDEVFDCWFESGSMPYAQVHYPFENKEKFEKNFPADFVAEGLDQTRGWFYTLTVIATHLFNEPAFKNLIVNGLVLAADGKKMSKRLKNYPDPMDVFERYGADAVRMYMCNSPVVRAEPLKFREEGVRDTVKEVFLPLYNAYRFLVQETCRFEKQQNTKFVPDRSYIHKSSNPTDHWIYATSQELLDYTRTELEHYRLYTIVGKLVSFLDDLTNWYIRMNRDRMRGGEDNQSTLESLNTLYDVMLNLTIVLAPITPFITELIYQNLRLALPDSDPRKEKSVHFVMMPDPDVQGLDPAIVTALNRMQTVVTLGRLLRDHRGVGLKTPLRRIRVIAEDQAYLDDIMGLENYVKDELNVMNLETSADTTMLETNVAPSFRALGGLVGKQMKKVVADIKGMTGEQIKDFQKTGSIEIQGFDLTPEHITVTHTIKDLGDPNLEATSQGDVTVVLDFTKDEDLLQLALAREITNRVQKLRKEVGLQQDDPVEMWATSEAKEVSKVLKEKSDYIDRLLRRPLMNAKELQGHEVAIVTEKFDIDKDNSVTVTLTRAGPHFNAEELSKLSGGKKDVEEMLKQYVLSHSPSELVAGLKPLSLNGVSYSLQNGVHYTANGAASAPYYFTSMEQLRAVVRTKVVKFLGGAVVSFVYTLLDRTLTILVMDGAAPSNVESLAVGLGGTASDALDMDQQNVGLTIARLLSKRFAPLQVVVSFNLVDAQDELVNAVQREIVSEVKCRDRWGEPAQASSKPSPLQNEQGRLGGLFIMYSGETSKGLTKKEVMGLPRPSLGSSRPAGGERSLLKRALAVLE
ncbi:hypothetical protein FOL47_007010 [Perkinsus chesapeaki]|uniref:isoleucine--tRNA ligase n=1 Tax=Perkinsus chesapeaki TaxID=330153 RepID=A0A7J6MWJ8_PERCH|nr:hypothetical protein FOL47_007010 [Perkinsus chesapeaki]